MKSKNYSSLPPYHFMKMHMEYMKNKYEKDQRSNYDLFLNDLEPDINKVLRLIEIDKDLIRLIENTNNKVFHRKLFFPSIFINNEFKFEDYTIKGILVQECLCEKGRSIRLSQEDIIKTKTEPNDFLITITGLKDLDNKNIENWNLVFYLLNETRVNDDIYDAKNLRNYIRNIICNIIDMVEGNDADLDVVTIETSKEQNEKRLKRKQIAFPTKIYIRAKGDFKKYVKKFNIDFENNIRKKIEHQFVVRGHWRNFRSEKFKKIGERTWIKPYWKGEGLIIAKEYKLIQDKIDMEIEKSPEDRKFKSEIINRAIRDGTFRKQILEIYNYKCAICGMQAGMVEACHIIAVENNGTDEITNGIALCFNHHKAFDSGLIWINEKYDIVLNSSKIEYFKKTNISGGLDKFIANSRIGEKIFLPENKKFHPSHNYLIKRKMSNKFNLEKVEIIKF